MVTGDISTGGTIAGVVEAGPLPEINFPTVGNSCSSRTVDEFAITGEIVSVE